MLVKGIWSTCALIPCLVVPEIGGLNPFSRLKTLHLNISKNIQLANPSFNQPQKVDLLLGADVFFGLLCVGLIKLCDGQPTLQKNRVGCLVTGSLWSGAQGGQNNLKSIHISLKEL